MALRLVIYGASYLEPLRVIAAINARRKRRAYEVIGFVDDDPRLEGQRIAGLPVLGTRQSLDRLRRSGAIFFHNVGGDPQVSFDVAQILLHSGCEVTGLVHPNIDQDRVCIGSGCFIPDSCSVGSDSVVGDFVAFRQGVVVSHNVRIGNHVLLSIRATVSSGSVIEDQCMLGASCTVVKSRIGKGSLVGAGAVVLKDVPRGTTVIGIPAKPLRRTHQPAGSNGV